MCAFIRRVAPEMSSLKTPEPSSSKVPEASSSKTPQMASQGGDIKKNKDITSKFFLRNNLVD